MKFFARAKQMKSQLLSVGNSLADDELAFSLLNGLSAEYKTLRTVLSATENRLHLDELLPKLLVLEIETNKPAPEQVVCGKTQLALGRPQGGKDAHQQQPISLKKIGKCHHCSKTGHLKKGCWMKLRSVSVRSKALAPHDGSGRMAMAGEPKAMWPVQPNRQLREKLGSLTQELQDIRQAARQANMSNMRPGPPETLVTFGNGSKASVGAVGDACCAENSWL